MRADSADPVLRRLLGPAAFRDQFASFCLPRRTGEMRTTLPWPWRHNRHVPTLFLMVGLPGAGKTTRATELAAEHRALRLSPDEWMIPLFGEPESGGKRDVLEGRLVWLALQALRLGTSVVLDFGLWGRGERSALRWLAASAEASCQVVYLPWTGISNSRGSPIARQSRRTRRSR